MIKRIGFFCIPASVQILLALLALRSKDWFMFGFNLLGAVFLIVFSYFVQKEFQK